MGFIFRLNLIRKGPDFVTAYEIGKTVLQCSYLFFYLLYFFNRSVIKILF